MKKHYIVITEDGNIRYTGLDLRPKDEDNRELIENKIGYNEQHENFQEIRPTKKNIAQLGKALRGMTK